jgi:DNA topoisomerase I
MLRIIDESAVLIGSQEYTEENDSFGLSTLTRRHVRTHGRTVELRSRASRGIASRSASTTRRSPGRGGRCWRCRAGRYSAPMEAP